MFDTPDQYYQAIADELASIFAGPWIKVEVEAKRFDSSIDLKVVYTKPDGSRESDVDEIMLPEYFYELANVISTQEKGLYKVCSFILESSGNFDVNFSY
ncbi:MAG: hypothetical protein B6D72_14335 [gamma proteobacterium symbiont of Ctena orbiculata]|nr:hypothetical protein [Candidatus Thiodiazotropha taylori]PVV09510.1 MAG: hypothetical protein B6D72_14335 [gamma proteobacterium symbiont of Ctena orbiculata]MBT2995742.1 hypothetical protein [Candidatus Thiodiazotropha taylori]MBT2999302.1 hypothetical protein [Candidatus Thiodiazotropha taylori]MBT3025537.1 hypothetical protein [Candidatus Thiodiazotropha taylori]